MAKPFIYRSLDYICIKDIPKLIGIPAAVCNAASPPEDPPGVLSMSQGFFETPYTGLDDSHQQPISETFVTHNAIAPACKLTRFLVLSAQCQTVFISNFINNEPQIEIKYLTQQSNAFSIVFCSNISPYRRSITIPHSFHPYSFFRTEWYS